MNINSPASIIRKDLKDELGLNSRQVSVRTSSGGGVDITIKVAGVSFDAVQEIGKRQESIRRCEYSHEILAGGNTFVFTSWDWRLLADAAKPIVPWVEALEADGGSTIHPVPGCADLDLGVSRENAWSLHLWNGSHAGQGGPAQIAELIAARLLELSRDFDPKGSTDPAPVVEEVEQVEAPAESMTEAMARKSKDLLTAASADHRESLTEDLNRLRRDTDDAIAKDLFRSFPPPESDVTLPIDDFPRRPSGGADETAGSTDPQIDPPTGPAMIPRDGIVEIVAQRDASVAAYGRYFDALENAQSHLRDAQEHIATGCGGKFSLPYVEGRLSEIAAFDTACETPDVESLKGVARRLVDLTFWGRRWTRPSGATMATRSAPG